MIQSSHATLRPEALTSLQGFLGQRFQANVLRRLKDPILPEEFVRRYEDKKYRDWFWLGEQIGKWLDASAYTTLINRDDTLRAKIDEVLERLAKTQEADGYLGITVFYNRDPVRGMELYEWYYVLLGLLECYHLLGSQLALDIATRIGRYILKTWGTQPGQFPLAGRFPGNGHTGGEGTLILEPIVRLGMATGDPAFLTWAEETTAMWDTWLDMYPESTHTCGLTAMKRFASGEIDIFEQRDNIHAHTFHMTLLGLAALYEATGKTEYRDIVLGCIDRIAADWVFITGGMSSGERYIPHRFYHAVDNIEVCPQHTWILLLETAYRWTGKGHYIAEIERTTFNQLLAAQLADGTNWSYMTPLNGRAQEPETPNCCNASGQRILARLPCYLYGLRENQPAVLLYTASSAVIQPPGLPTVRLQQSTAFPSDGEVRIQVSLDTPASFRLYLRIPPYAASATASVNGAEAAVLIVEDGFAFIEREWVDGDTVELVLPFPVSYHSSDREVAVIRGPLVYAYFQNAQASNEHYHWHHARYPSEVELQFDPAVTLDETTAADGLLGPALRAAINVPARAPMFASHKTNQPLLEPYSESGILLPFANQGSLRGQYQVFMRYR